MNVQKTHSKFSIKEKLEQKEEENHLFAETKTDDLPNQHFSEKDLADEWMLFIAQIRQKDVVLYSAIHGFKFSKKDENTIVVNYPSDSAKAEFDKVQAEFFSNFKRKMNHYTLTVDYKMDVALKKEIMTKRKLFEKMVEINPLLKDLDDLMKFDFS